MKLNGFSLQFTCILFLLFLGCSRDKEQWENIEKINSIKSYHDFIKEYPKSEYSKLAKSKIDSLEYELTLKENTEASYLAYYENFPNSKFANESWNKAASIAYENVREETAESTYINFIDKYSGSEYEQEAKIKAENLRFNQIKYENSVNTVQQFITDYPQSEFVDTAKMIIKDIENGRRLWSDKEFAEKVKNVNEKDYSKIWKYKFMLIDGGNEHTFKPDKRNGTIPVIAWDEQGLDTVNFAQLLLILFNESIDPSSRMGIGEIFFWNRSIVLYCFEEGTPDKFMDELYNLHKAKSKKHLDGRGGFNFSIICTFE